MRVRVFSCFYYRIIVDLREAGREYEIVVLFPPIFLFFFIFRFHICQGADVKQITQNQKKDSKIILNICGI